MKVIYHLAANGKSFAADWKIIRLRLKNRLAQKKTRAK